MPTPRMCLIVALVCLSWGAEGAIGAAPADSVPPATLTRDLRSGSSSNAEQSPYRLKDYRLREARLELYVLTPQLWRWNRDHRTGVPTAAATDGGALPNNGANVDGRALPNNGANVGASPWSSSPISSEGMDLIAVQVRQRSKARGGNIFRSVVGGIARAGATVFGAAARIVVGGSDDKLTQLVEPSGPGDEYPQIRLYGSGRRVEPTLRFRGMLTRDFESDDFGGDPSGAAAVEFFQWWSVLGADSSLPKVDLLVRADSTQNRWVRIELPTRLLARISRDIGERGSKIAAEHEELGVVHSLGPPMPSSGGLVRILLEGGHELEAMSVQPWGIHDVRIILPDSTARYESMSHIGAILGPNNEEWTKHVLRKGKRVPP